MNDLPRSLSVLAVPAFEDNSLWLIHDGVHAAAINLGDSAPIFAALAAHQLTLTAILLTHQHADHTGGVSGLLRAAPVPVALCMCLAVTQGCAPSLRPGRAERLLGRRRRRVGCARSAAPGKRLRPEWGGPARRGATERTSAWTLASSSGIIARTISAVTLRPSSSTPLLERIH